MKIIYSNGKVVEATPSGVKPIKPLESNLKPLKRLIYLICMGPDKYVDMLNMCLYSLVKNGQFYGDIVVLSDFDTFDNRYGINLAGVNLRIVNVWKDVEKHIDWGVSKVAWFTKTKIFDYVNPNDYSDVMYLDIDTIVNGNVNELFEQLQSYPVLVQHDGIGRVTKALRQLERHYKIPDIHIDAFKDMSCCSGVFVLTDFNIIREWNKVVYDVYSTTPNISNLCIGDQELLQVAIIRSGYTFANLKGAYFYRKATPSKLIISHFMNKRYGIMKEYFFGNIKENTNEADIY
jgi:hypothetical protein